MTETATNDRQPVAEPEGSGDYYCATCGEHLGYAISEYVVRRQHRLSECVKFLAWIIGTHNNDNPGELT